MKVSVDVSRFDNINYLAMGNAKQRRLYYVLTKYQIITLLHEYTPVVTGTIPIAVDIDQSDVDIACYWQNKEEFVKSVGSFFNQFALQVSEKKIGGHITIIARFEIENFSFEIFGQNRQVKEQESYLHMLVEYNILRKRGTKFKRQIVELKEKGFKTEPAFAKLLGLKGDPYTELLRMR